MKWNEGNSKLVIFAIASLWVVLLAGCEWPNGNDTVGIGDQALVWNELEKIVICSQPEAIPSPQGSFCYTLETGHIYNNIALEEIDTSTVPVNTPLACLCLNLGTGFTKGRWEKLNTKTNEFDSVFTHEIIRDQDLKPVGVTSFTSYISGDILHCFPVCLTGSTSFPRYQKVIIE